MFPCRDPLLVGVVFVRRRVFRLALARPWLLRPRIGPSFADGFLQSCKPCWTLLHGVAPRRFSLRCLQPLRLRSKRSLSAGQSGTLHCCNSVAERKCVLGSLHSSLSKMSGLVRSLSLWRVVLCLVLRRVELGVRQVLHLTLVVFWTTFPLHFVRLEDVLPSRLGSLLGRGPFLFGLRLRRRRQAQA